MVSEGDKGTFTVGKEQVVTHGHICVAIAQVIWTVVSSNYFYVAGSGQTEEDDEGQLLKTVLWYVQHIGSTAATNGNEPPYSVFST
jgi:hypothetical protein